jgi:hypothetical protein
VLIIATISSTIEMAADCEDASVCPGAVHDVIEANAIIINSPIVGNLKNRSVFAGEIPAKDQLFQYQRTLFEYATGFS